MKAALDLIYQADEKRIQTTSMTEPVEIALPDLFELVFRLDPLFFLPPPVRHSCPRDRSVAPKIGEKERTRRTPRRGSPLTQDRVHLDAPG